jgi:hypothetical protein
VPRQNEQQAVEFGICHFIQLCSNLTIISSCNDWQSARLVFIFLSLLSSRKVTQEEERLERTSSRSSTSFERQVAVRYGICYFAPHTLWRPSSY